MFKPDWHNYVIFESLYADTPNIKTIYVINFDTKTEINIGRSNDIDLKMTDTSISRSHARLSKIGNQIFFSDLNSKFGSLVLLQNPYFPIYKNLVLSLQLGRTLINFRFPGSCCLSRISFRRTKKEQVDYWLINNSLITVEKDNIVKVQVDDDEHNVSNLEEGIKVNSSYNSSRSSSRNPTIIYQDMLDQDEKLNLTIEHPNAIEDNNIKLHALNQSECQPINQKQQILDSNNNSNADLIVDIFFT